MKRYSTSFNKKTRLITSPQVADDHDTDLPRLDPASLTARLSDMLRVKHDVYPCFDWVFPPPIFPKSPGPSDVSELFTYPSRTPDTYSIYIHIPFCNTLCSFCYYRVLPGRPREETVTYVDYLLREMAMYQGALRGQRCESIYIGGGTPTYLDHEQLTRLFEGIHQNFDLTDCAEITVESAPGTLPAEKVALLARLGANRLSYGIQSLNEELLASMNRFYRVDEAIEELEAAISCIGNINIDTMYGFDNEPDDALLKTLSTFHDIGIPCLTMYALDTQRTVRKSLCDISPTDDLFFAKIDLYHRAVDLLAEFGYESLFQNTFAKPGKGSYIHQLRRWDNVPLIALGVGSMGYTPRITYQNYGVPRAYRERIDSGSLPIEALDRLSPEMEMARQVTSQLRFTRLDLRKVRQTYGVDLDVVFEHLLASLSELGFVERDGDVVWLSREAAPFNDIIPMLFSPDSFKHDLLGLPSDYIELMPSPHSLVKLGETQSAALRVTTNADARVTTS